MTPKCKECSCDGNIQQPEYWVVHKIFELIFLKIPAIYSFHKGECRMPSKNINNIENEADHTINRFISGYWLFPSPTTDEDSHDSSWELLQVTTTFRNAPFLISLLLLGSIAALQSGLLHFWNSLISFSSCTMTLVFVLKPLSWSSSEDS